MKDIKEEYERQINELKEQRDQARLQGESERIESAEITNGLKEQIKDFEILLREEQLKVKGGEIQMQQMQKEYQRKLEILEEEMTSNWKKANSGVEERLKDFEGKLENQKQHYEKQLEDIKFLHEQELLSREKEAVSPMPWHSHALRPFDIRGEDWQRAKCADFCLDCEKWEEVCEAATENKERAEELQSKLDEQR